MTRHTLSMSVDHKNSPSLSSPRHQSLAMLTAWYFANLRCFLQHTTAIEVMSTAFTANIPTMTTSLPLSDIAVHEPSSTKSAADGTSTLPIAEWAPLASSNLSRTC